MRAETVAAARELFSGEKLHSRHKSFQSSALEFSTCFLPPTCINMSPNMAATVLNVAELKLLIASKMGHKELTRFASTDKDSATKLRSLVFSHITIYLHRSPTNPRERTDIEFLRENPEVAKLIKHLVIKGKSINSRANKYSGCHTLLVEKTLLYCENTTSLSLEQVRWRGGPPSLHVQLHPILTSLHFKSVTSENANPMQLLTLNSSWKKVTTRDCDIALFFIPITLNLPRPFSIHFLSISGPIYCALSHNGFSTEKTWISSIQVTHLEVALDRRSLQAIGRLLEGMSDTLQSLAIKQPAEYQGK